MTTLDVEVDGNLDQGNLNMYKDQDNMRILPP